MLRKIDCEKYRAWKKEQAKKLQKTKKTVKKRKKDDLSKDCLEDDEQDSIETKPLTKVTYQKCKKKKKKKPRRMIRAIVKYISEGKAVMKCIKPSVEDRQYVLSPHHNICKGVSEADAAFALEELRPSVADLFYMPKRRILRQRKRPCRKRRIEDIDSDDSECLSICSFDSDICLAGVKLTAKDKEEIKRIQDKVKEAAEKM